MVPLKFREHFQPIMTVAETQASSPNTASAGVQSDGPQTKIFDLAIDDQVAEFADNIQAEL